MKVNYYSPIPKDRTVALVFDVETTGLLRRGTHNLDESPYVLQLSYAMYDCENRRLLKTVDSYIKIPVNVKIPKEASDVNHITSEMCADGYPMVELLKEFYEDYHKSTVLVAHNYKFDSTMLTIEFQRHWAELASSHPYALNIFQYTYAKSRKMRHMCTMESSTELCKLPHAKRQKEGNPITYKWPTLLELNTHLFGDEQQPTNLHNSMVDVMVTMRCYIKMEFNYVIFVPAAISK